MSDINSNDDGRQDFIDGLADVFRDAGANVTVSENGVMADFRQADMNNQPNGTTWFNEGVVYYRGDGVNDTVLLPPPGAIVSITPAYPYEYDPLVCIVKFSAAIPLGEVVTIKLEGKAE